MTPSPSEARSIEDYRDLDPYEFEHAVADLWHRRGYETEVRDQSRDAGVDVVAWRTEPYPEKIVIQAKRYAPGNKVSSREIQQYASLREQEGADAVVVVTTSAFTADARERAADLNVKLIDGEQLERMATGARSDRGTTPPAETPPPEMLTAEDAIESATDSGASKNILWEGVVWGAALIAGVASLVGHAVWFVLQNPEETVRALVSLIVVAVLLYAFWQIFITLSGVPF